MCSGYDAERVGSCLASIDRIEHDVAAVDDPAGDIFQEEYDAVHSALARLGVVNADKLSYVHSVTCLDQLPDVVTPEFVQNLLEVFEFDSSHSKVEALIAIDQLIKPIARLVRAARIWNKMFWWSSDLRCVRSVLEALQERMTSPAT